MTRFATVGHSRRSLEAFVCLLRDADVVFVADVRSFPKSRSNPAYNVDVLPDRLAERQIGYRHMPALGGRRGRQPGVPEEVNVGWRNQSFHNHADYALSPEFADALAELRELGRARYVAIMCAEAVWWRCHRRIIADHLIFCGHEVVHLIEPGHAAVARPTPGARRTDDGLVIYPASEDETLLRRRRAPCRLPTRAERVGYASHRRARPGAILVAPAAPGTGPSSGFLFTICAGAKNGPCGMAAYLIILDYGEADVEASRPDHSCPTDRGSD